MKKFLFCLVLSLSAAAFLYSLLSGNAQVVSAKEKALPICSNAALSADCTVPDVAPRAIGITADDVGLYFLSRMDAAASNRRFSNGEILTVRRVQGILEFTDSHLSLMNNLRGGGMMGFGAGLPKDLRITSCGQDGDRSLILSMNRNERMIAVGAVSYHSDANDGRYESGDYTWTKLDLCPEE